MEKSSSVVKGDQSSENLPRGVCRYANEYLNAAVVLQRYMPHKISGIARQPAMLCVGQAIELALKSTLLVAGHKQAILRKKPFGHNLNELFNEALVQSFDDCSPLSEDERIALSMLSTEYVGRYLQYINPGPLEVPPFDMLVSIATTLVKLASTKTGWRFEFPTALPLPPTLYKTDSPD